MYKFLNDKRKMENRERLEHSINKLKEFCIEYESKNNGVHFVIKKNDDVYDFYPSTGKYRVRGRNRAKFGIWKFGVYNLLKDMGVLK